MSTSFSTLPAPPTVHRLLLPLLAFSQFIIAIDYNIVVVALPDIGADLGFSANSLQWIISAYALTFGGLLLFGGRAADVLGRRKTMLVGLAVFGVSSAIAAIAVEPTLLLAARGLQGLGGALLFPAVLATINTAFREGAPRYRALSVWSGAGAVGLAMGSLLGGVLTSAFGWKAVFIVNLPLVLVAIAAARVAMPVDLGRDPSTKLDAPGAALATAGLVLVVLGLVQGTESGWLSPIVLGSLATGLAVLATFVLRESRTSHALMPLRLFGNRNLVTAMLTAFIFMGAVGSMYYIFTIYLQEVIGFDALQTGLAFLPWAIFGIVGSRLAQFTLGRFGLRSTLVGGMVVAAAGVALIGVTLVPGAPYWWALPGLVVLAAGQAMGFASLFVAAGAGVAPGEQGVAAALTSTSQQIGSAVGLAAIIAIASAIAGDPGGILTPTDLAFELRAATFTASGLLLIGAIVALRLPRASAGRSEGRNLQDDSRTPEPASQGV